jgi:WD40 repeat protein
MHIVVMREMPPVAVALTSDGSTMVVAYNTNSGGAIGTQRISAPSSIVAFEERQDLPPVTCLALSSDDQSVLVGDNSGGLWLFSVGSRRLTASTTLESSISTVAFHPNGAIVAAGTAGRLHILNAEDLSLVLASSAEAGYSKTVDLAYNPDGSLLAAILDDEVVILNSETYEVVATLLPE